MIYLVTGGQRAGKSSYAQELALSLSNSPVYVATARVLDEDFEERVDRHKKDRDQRWRSIEREKMIGELDLQEEVAVIDCMTLWLTNFFMDTNQKVEQCIKLAQTQLDKLFEQEATMILVTNEIGMGTHAPSESGRKFTDLQGWINQYVAEKADKVVLMVSGIPVTIKESKQ